MSYPDLHEYDKAQYPDYHGHIGAMIKGMSISYGIQEAKYRSKKEESKLFSRNIFLDILSRLNFFIFEPNS